MKIILIITSLLYLPAAYAQRTPPPPPQKQMPGKDPVMVINNSNAGNSKTYHWHSGILKMGITCEEGAGNKLSAIWNNKPVLKHYTLTAEKKNLQLKLTKKKNILVFYTNKGSKKDAFKANFILSDKEVMYNLNVQCTKTQRDTIIIERN